MMLKVKFFYMDSYFYLLIYFCGKKDFVYILVIVNVF